MDRDADPASLPPGQAGKDRVSVVVATDQGSKALAAALASILANDGPPFEVLVADCSDDDNIARSVADIQTTRSRTAKTLRLLSTPGLTSAAATNAAIGQARGEIVAITDFDCVVAPNWIESMVTAFDQDPQVALVFGNVYPAPTSEESGHRPHYIRQAEFLARAPRDKPQIEGIWACSGLRRSAWQALGGFDERLGKGATFPGGADSDLVIRALAVGYRVFETPRVEVTHHRLTASDIARDVVDGYTLAAGAIFAKHLRCRTPGMAALVLDLGRRWLAGLTHSAASVDGSARRSHRAVAFARGFLAGLRAPLDKKRRLFV